MKSLTRRDFCVAAIIVVGSPSKSFAAPELVFLPEGAKGIQVSIAIGAKPKEISLAGWMLCNGAAISRIEYQELFSVISERFGAGDGTRTFNIPTAPIEYRARDLYKGTAISYSTAKLGYPAGVINPFILESTRT